MKKGLLGITVLSLSTLMLVSCGQSKDVKVSKTVHKYETEISKEEFDEGYSILDCYSNLTDKEFVIKSSMISEKSTGPNTVSITYARIAECEYDKSNSIYLYSSKNSTKSSGYGMTEKEFENKKYQFQFFENKYYLYDLVKKESYDEKYLTLPNIIDDGIPSDLPSNKKENDNFKYYLDDGWYTIELESNSNYDETSINDKSIYQFKGDQNSIVVISKRVYKSVGKFADIKYTVETIDYKMTSCEYKNITLERVDELKFKPGSDYDYEWFY